MSPVTNEQFSAVELDLSQNKLEGGVPTSIFEMSKLGKVLVGGLAGGLSPLTPFLTLFCHLCAERLRLDDNQLTGTLPPHIGAATNLRKKYPHHGCAWTLSVVSSIVFLIF
jgi:hypothetical protein